VHATRVVTLNDARTLPFQLELNLRRARQRRSAVKYRYLDLRRPQLQANLQLRHRVLREIRRYMDERASPK